MRHPALEDVIHDESRVEQSFRLLSDAAESVLGLREVGVVVREVREDAVPRPGERHADACGSSGAREALQFARLEAIGDR